jgi:type I restriction enzyme S subunit
VRFLGWANGRLERAIRAKRKVIALLNEQKPVTARKDDAPAADQAAITNLAGLASFSGGGGLIQTTSG